MKWPLNLAGENELIDDPPRRLLSPIVARTKILSGINIAERRVIGSGGFVAVKGDETTGVLTRITIPGEWGETITFRFLYGSHH